MTLELQKTEADNCDAQSGLSPAPLLGGFSFAEVPLQDRCRWFLRRGAKTAYNRGWRTKQEVRDWIESLGRRVDWRVGFVFMLRGDNEQMEIVNRKGVTSA